MMLKTSTAAALLLSGLPWAQAGESPAPPAPVYLSAAVSVTSQHADPAANQRGDDVHVAPAPPNAGQRASALLNILDPDPPTNSAGATASAGFGWLTSNAGAGVSSQPPVGSLAVHVPVGYSATTGWNSSLVGALFFRDALTIDAVGLTGQAGILHASMRFSAATSASLGGPPLGADAHEGASGQAHASFAIGSSVDNIVRYDFLQNSYAMPGGSGAELIVTQHNGNDVLYDGAPQSYVAAIDLPFIFGKPIGISANADSFAGAAVNPPTLSPSDPLYAYTRYAVGAATLDLHWSGIQSVTLAPPPRPQGQDVAPTGGEAIVFTVSSLSGADYRAALSPVPEPASGLLLAAGLVALGARRQAARRRVLSPR